MLTPRVHAAEIDDDVVLLDVAADTYYCLPGAGPAWRALRGGQATDEASALATLLTESGLIGAGDDSPARLGLRDLPACRIAPRPNARLRAADLRRLLAAWLDLMLHYEHRPFAHILEFVRRPGHGRPSDDVEELARLCAVFDRAVVWLPVSGKCLVRSFLRLRFLQRAGHDAAWVFGVRTWPFLAHCWLQVGDVVLDDWPERLTLYTPILDA